VKYKTENIVLIILAFAVAYPVCTYFTAIFFLKQETNELNAPLRLAFVNMVNNLQISITNIVMYKLGERKDNRL
jgi:hypothetical protein